MGSKLVAWYDASADNGMDLTGSNIDQWNDLSGQGRHLLPTGATAQTGHSLNGKSVMYNTNDDYIMNVATSPFGATIEDAGAFFVLKEITRTNSTDFSLNGSPATAGRWQSHYPWSGGSLIYSDIGGTSGSTRISVVAPFSAGEAVVAGIYGSTTDSVQEIWCNGNNIASDADSHSVTVTGNITIGMGSTNADYAEFIFTQGTLSNDEKDLIQGYLAHQWGLSGNLVSGHAYENSFP